MVRGSSTVDRVKPKSAIGLLMGGLALLAIGTIAVVISSAIVDHLWGSTLSFAWFLIAGLFVLGWTTYWVATKHEENVQFRNTWVSTEGTVDLRALTEHSSSYGDSVEYHLFVSFTANERFVGIEDQSASKLRMSLKADVSQEIYNSASVGKSITVRYVPRRPEIALLEGE